MKETLLVYIVFSLLKTCPDQNVTIQSVSVFKSFYKAGTSKLLVNIFEDPLKYKVEKSFIDLGKEDILFLEELLNSAKVKRHRQMKINVDLALVVRIGDTDHYFIVSESSNLIIDLTSNLNYTLNTDKLKDKAKELLLRAKSPQ